VNTVNKKDCLVEVDFSIDGKQYKVRRGISPNIFEIYIEGKLQDELSAVKDQQKYLEVNILKMSYKTFMQVVVLGSNNYVPFMQLSSAERRDLVEELLDIKIFSAMNIILKDKIKNIERKLQEIELSKISICDKIEMQSGFIEKIKTSGLELIEDKQSKVNSISDKINSLNTKLETLFDNLQLEQNKLSEISFSTKKLKKLLGIEGTILQKKTILEEEVTFFNHNSICPTCKQDLQVDFKENKIKEISNEINTINSGYNELTSIIQEEEEKEKLFTKITNNITQINVDIKTNKNEIKLLDRQIFSLNTEINEIQDSIKNQNEEEKLLENLIKTKNKIQKEYLKCTEALHYFEFSHLLMKDGGVKSKIIKRYLPIINNQINNYLQMMDLYINFTLDEEFKETINTPLHEGFSYSSFSEGEKQRINLAAILSWREVSRLKNSANCNLIFFDETLDSSLDASGIDDFIKIINYVVTNSNIFVISHREGFDDRFEKVLEVKKINGFSKVSS
jgi:DNA repair exonuclease SbcCD ATPase subunit